MVKFSLSFLIVVSMRNIPKSVQKVFDLAKASPGLSIYEISKQLGVDYKNTHSSIGWCEAYGLLRSQTVVSNNRRRREVSVPPDLLGVDLSDVSLASGQRMLAAKQSKRAEFFKEHGSMTNKNPEPSLVIKSPAFDKW